MQTWIFWIIFALAALLIEIFTLGFAIFCFAVGGFAAAITAYIGGEIAWQLATFSIFTTISLIFVRPLAIKYFAKSREDRTSRTNADALIGRQGVVSEQICDGRGRIKIDGDDWRATTEDLDEVIEVGTRVVVTHIESIILTVKKV